MAEEITQETFFKVLKALDRFDGKCKVYVWLCQIAKNTYFTMQKRGQRVEHLPLDEEELANKVFGGASSPGGESSEQN